jgi:LPXTG-site transpeptidase (sortase) family protein
MNAYFYPNHSQDPAAQSQPIKEVKTKYTDKQNTLEVAKISVSLPIIFSNSTDEKSLMKDLDAGVVYYPGSVYPGQTGQIIILGHSAPPGWPHIKHDWAFTDLDKLVPGDAILIDLNNKQYTYIVKQKNIIKRGAEVPTDNSIANNNVLTLVSCWPPGKDYQRIAVLAELQSI